MRGFFKRFMSLLLSVVMAFTVSVSASAIFQKDDEIEDLIGETGAGWSSDLLTVYGWTVTSDLTQDVIEEDYEITRDSQYTEEYLNDLVTTTKEYLGIKTTSRGGGNIAAVALAEWEKAQNMEEGTYELTGNNDGVKYNTWYYGYEVYGNDTYPWCCVFVSWCANECGYLDDIVLPSNGGHGYAGCTTLYNVIVGPQYGYESHYTRDCYPLGSEYTPVPGDLIFFAGSVGVWEHIGIVVEVTDEYIRVVDGNCGNTVNTHYWYSEKDLSGNFYYNSRIVHVIYPDVDGSVESIFNYMTETLGYTKCMATAIMSCMFLESGLCAKNWGWDGDGIGYGLCMWTNKYKGSSSMLTGFTRMVKWCDDNGYAFDSTVGQLEYLDYWLKNNYTVTTLDSYNKLFTYPDTDQGVYAGSVK